MSLRHLRRIVGNSDLPPADADEDEYEPSCAQRSSQPKYYGLIESSESEKEIPSDQQSEPEDIVVPVKTRKNKSRKKGKKGKSTSTDAAGSLKLDEIDRSLMEVNALLGAPPEPSTSADNPVIFSYPEVMKTTRACLNVNVEMKRLFGPPTEGNRRSNIHTNYKLLVKKIYVMPLQDTELYEYTKRGGYGISMIINRRENNITYFTYEHNGDYQEMHRAYLNTLKYREMVPLLDWGQALNNMHVEAIMEVSDSLFQQENYSLANNMLENVVTFLQTAAHPSFNLTSGDVRLEYKYWENRPFHVAMLKYIYMLTNKACHRTALELAKMLLNIDPSDPLAVLFIIDTLALRAREHQWLVEAFDYFRTIRDAGLLFNMLYSRALALYHLANKNKGDMKEADDRLQEAIIAYPTVVTLMLKFASISNPRIMEHELFTQKPVTVATEGLNVLMFIYAKLCYPRFREPGVVNWLQKNALEVAEAYTNDDQVKKRVKEMANMRNSLFRMWPMEVVRHLGVIKNIAHLLFDEPLPRFRRETCAWDPLQDGGINRYGYKTLINPPPAIAPPGSIFYRFFSSMMPSYNN